MLTYFVVLHLVSIEACINFQLLKPQWLREIAGHVSILEVPYSEHSSYSELKRFVQYLRIGSERDIIPTVNLRNRENMAHIFRQWIRERKEKGPESQ